MRDELVSTANKRRGQWQNIRRMSKYFICMKFVKLIVKILISEYKCGPLYSNPPLRCKTLLSGGFCPQSYSKRDQGKKTKRISCHSHLRLCWWFFRCKNRITEYNWTMGISAGSTPPTIPTYNVKEIGDVEKNYRRLYGVLCGIGSL